MKLLMKQLHNTDFLKTFSIKVQDIMLKSAYVSWNYADLCTIFLEILITYLKNVVMC